MSRQSVVHFLRSREVRGSAAVPMRWTDVFQRLLARVLDAQPYWDDLVLSVEDDGDCVFIHPRTPAFRRLTIEVWFDHPCFGFSRDGHPDYANEWSRRVVNCRRARLRLRPHAFFARMLHVEGPTQRFVGFDAWQHAAYVTHSPYANLSVFHEDFGISHYVVGLVEVAIREHYRDSEHFR